MDITESDKIIYDILKGIINIEYGDNQIAILTKNCFCRANDLSNLKRKLHAKDIEISTMPELNNTLSYTLLF